MSPIIKWELRSRKTAILWWTLSAVAICVLILLVYPPLKHQAAQFNKVINQLPEGLRQLKAGSTGHVDVANPVDFLNANLYYISLPILFIILTITRGSALIGREEQSHTLELLLARPVSRQRLVRAKALSGAIETFIVAAVSTLATIVFAKVVKLDIGVSRLVVMGLYTWLFCLSFGAIAFALTTAGRLTKGASTAVAVLLSFGSYLLVSLSGLSQTVADIAKFLPYHFFEPERILRGQSVTSLNIYLIAVFVVCAFIAHLGFRARDIE